MQAIPPTLPRQCGPFTGIILVFGRFLIVWALVWYAIKVVWYASLILRRAVHSLILQRIVYPLHVTSYRMNAIGRRPACKCECN